MRPFALIPHFEDVFQVLTCKPQNAVFVQKMKRTMEFVVLSPALTARRSSVCCVSHTYTHREDVLMISPLLTPFVVATCPSDYDCLTLTRATSTAIVIFASQGELGEALSCSHGEVPHNQYSYIQQSRYLVQTAVHVVELYNNSERNEIKSYRISSPSLDRTRYKVP